MNNHSNLHPKMTPLSIQYVDTHCNLPHIATAMEIALLKFVRWPACFLYFLSMASCTSQSTSSHFRFAEVLPSTSHRERIAILGTSDLHGQLFPQEVPSQGLTRGGVAQLASYIQILREEFRERLIWLDAGDQLQGTLESTLDQGQMMVKFLNQFHLTAAALGHHEWDWGGESLKQRIQEAKFPYLAANLVNSISKQSPQFAPIRSHLLHKTGQVNVGIIGLSGPLPPSNRLPLPPDFSEPLHLEEWTEATLRESQKLRMQGAQIILLVAHDGFTCLTPTGSRTLFRKPTDRPGQCHPSDEFVRFLRLLPNGTLDGIVAGHTHQLTHQWIGGIPVIQAGDRGFHFNVLYFTYDTDLGKLIPEETRIEGPVAVCQKKTPHALCSEKFHGRQIHPHLGLEAALKQVQIKTQIAANRVLGYTSRRLEYSPSRESTLGNLVADAIRIRTQTDVALVHPGAIRGGLEPGPITYGKIFRVFPYESAISTLTLTLPELRLFLQIAENGSYGFASLSGVRVKLIDPSLPAPQADLNRSGRWEPWKLNRLLEMYLPSGAPFTENRLYTLATLDFLAAGGEGLHWIVSQIPSERIQLHSGIIARDAIIEYIQNRLKSNHLKNLSSLSQLEAVTQKPRIEFQKHTPVRREQRKRAPTQNSARPPHALKERAKSFL